MHLAKRGRGSGLGIDRAEQDVDRLVQLRLDDRHDVAERSRWHFVLQGAEHVEGPLRQEIGARAEELAELDHQDAELDRRLAKRDQHVDEQLEVGLDVGVALLAGAQHAAPLAIDDPDRPQQQPRHAHEPDRLGQPIDPKPLGLPMRCCCSWRCGRCAHSHGYVLSRICVSGWRVLRVALAWLARLPVHARCDTSTRSA